MTQRLGQEVAPVDVEKEPGEGDSGEKEGRSEKLTRVCGCACLLLGHFVTFLFLSEDIRYRRGSWRIGSTMTPQ